MLSEPYILFGLWLHLLQHRCYQVARFDVDINQVSTLLCNQTCQLKFKFMQLCWNWTNSWLVHVTSSQVNLGLLLHAFCMFHAINSWSSSSTLVQLNCQSLNVFVRRRRNRNVWWLVLALHQHWTVRAYNVLIQQQLPTEELFSQLPMYVLLKHHCNNKMKRRLSTWLLHYLNFDL
jgi:hypothetical protein